MDYTVDRCPGQAGNAEDGCVHAELDLGLDPLAMKICPLKGDPISIYSGNHMESEEDVRFASPFTKGLVFKRFYNSRSETSGALGYGWTHSYQLTLKKNSSPIAAYEIVISDETGFGRHFSQYNETPVRIEALFSERSQLALEAGNYIWRRPDGSAAAFDAESLRLLWLEDEVGNRQEIGWNTGLNPARIETVTDLASGRVLIFGYTGERLTAINLHTGGVDRGTWVSYGHDAKGNLTTVAYAEGTGFQYEYNDIDNNPALAPFSNNMTLKKNAANHELASWRYDEQDRCWFNESRDDGGVTLDYDSSAGQVIVTDAYGKNRTYTLTRVNGRKRISEASGDPGCASCLEEVSRAAYDAALNVTEKQYANGLIQRYADFDARGNPGTVTYAAGSPAERVVHFTYHPSMNVPLTRGEKSLLSTQDALTIWDYDEDGNDAANENPARLVRRIVRKGFTQNVSGGVIAFETVTRLSYDARGQLVSIDGPRAGSADTIGFSYDAVTGDLQTTTRPLSGTTRFANYTPSGRPQQMTDANGNPFSYAYGGRDRLQTVTRLADHAVTRYDYNTAGKLETVTQANGAEASFSYDPLKGRLQRIQTLSGNYIQQDYDAYGNLGQLGYVTAADLRTYWQRFNYQHPDKPGKLWKLINPDNSFAEYLYDGVGNLQSLTDAAGRTTAFAHDALNRIRAVTQPGNRITDHCYDTHGNLSQLKDAQNKNTSYAYDDLGRRLSTTSPDTGVSRYEYDEAGSLRYAKDAEAVQVGYQYDALTAWWG